MDCVLSPKSIQSETSNANADKQNYLFFGIERRAHTQDPIPICPAEDQNQLHGKLFPVKVEGRRTFTAGGEFGRPAVIPGLHNNIPEMEEEEEKER